MKFQACLDALMTKESGLFDTIKDVALTEVANTKPWIIGRKKPLADGLKSTGRLIAGAKGPPVHGSGVSGVRKAVRSSGGGGVYDVSAMAREMGIK